MAIGTPNKKTFKDIAINNWSKSGGVRAGAADNGTTIFVITK